MSNKKPKQEPQLITADEYIRALFQDAQPIPENAFTIEEVMASQPEMSRSGIVRRLDGEVRAGKLEKKRGRRNGKSFNFYVPIKK